MKRLNESALALSRELLNKKITNNLISARNSDFHWLRRKGYLIQQTESTSLATSTAKPLAKLTSN